jgi:hypothetical protein
MKVLLKGNLSEEDSAAKNARSQAKRDMVLTVRSHGTLDTRKEMNKRERTNNLTYNFLH